MSRAASRGGFRCASAGRPTACCSSGRASAACCRRRSRCCSSDRWGWRASFVVVRHDRPGVGRGVVRVVSRSAVRASGCHRARNSRGSSRTASRAMRTRSRRRGERCCTAAISTRSARCTSRSATACTSTSRGCRRISSASWGSPLLDGGLFAALPFLSRASRTSRAGGSPIVLARHRGLRVARCGLGFGSFLPRAARAHVRVDPRAAADREGGAARVRAGVRRSGAGACWAVCLDIGARPRRRRHRLHEHVRQPRRPDRRRSSSAYAVDRWQSWTFPFYVTAVVYATGALIWLAIDPEQPIVTQA